jgi:hypothetical protein
MRSFAALYALCAILLLVEDAHAGDKAPTWGNRGSPSRGGWGKRGKQQPGVNFRKGVGSLKKKAPPTLKLKSQGPWTYLKFTPTKIRNPEHVQTYVQVGEFEFFSNMGVISGVTATNPGGDNPPGEGPAEAVDGSLRTKWLDRKGKPIIFRLPQQTFVDSFNFATGFDKGNKHRDPVRWTLEGSNNQREWETVHKATTDWDAPEKRRTWYSPVNSASKAVDMSAEDMATREL